MSNSTIHRRHRIAGVFVFLATIATSGFAFAGAGAAGKDAETAPEEKRNVTVTPQIAEKLILANERLEKDDVDDALEIVDELAGLRRLEPADLAQIHRFRGYIYVTKGKTKEAAEEFEKSLGQKALDAGAEQGMIYSLAQIYTQLDRYDRALELINGWFERVETPKADAYYLKAMILVQQEDFKAALEPAKTAISMSTQPRESWLQLLAAIHFQLQDYPNLATTLQQLVAAAPASKRYWVQLATVQNYMGRDADAVATMRLAYQAKLLTEDRDLRQLARLLFVRELPFECASVVKNGMDAGVIAADAEAYRLLANCYIAARDSERAIDPLAHAGELATDGEMFLLLGQMHLQRDRFEPALEVLGKALAKAKPEQRAPVQLLMGVAQLGTNRYAEAERAFRAAQDDAKVRDAAASYLKFIEERRVRVPESESEQDERLASAS
jgi:tetratricopeptide (TPR) repeat protein